MKKLMTIAVLGLTFALAAAYAHGVEDREYALQRRVAVDIEQRRISPRDASRIEHDLDKVARHINGERNEHRGRLTPREWERLNRELDRVEDRLRDVERYAPRYDRRYEQNGYRERGYDRPRW